MISTSTNTVPKQFSIPVDLSDKVSPARLTTWLSCPLKFRFKYIDGIGESMSSRLFLGKRVHEALGYLYRGRMEGNTLSVEDVKIHILETWSEAVVADEIQFESHKDEDTLREQCLSLVQTYYDNVDVDGESIPIAVLQRCDVALIDPDTNEELGASLECIFDLVLQTPTGPVIVDFKTTARSNSSPDVAYDIVLACFAYSFRQSFCNTECELEIRSLIRTKTPKLEIRSFPARDRGQFRRMFAAIRAYLDDLHTNRFVYRPGWPCSMCQFRQEHCAAWEGQFKSNT